MWHTRRRSQELRDLISGFRSKFGNLSQSEAKQLQEHYEELAELQRKCAHSYDDVVFFTSVRSVCGSCGHERPPGDRRGG